MAKKSEKRPNGRPKRMVKVGSVAASPPTAASLIPVSDHGVRLTKAQEEAIRNFTDDHRRQLMLHAFARAGTIAGACGLLHDPDTGHPVLSPSMHKSWLKEDPEYKELYEELEEAVSARWEEVLFDKAKNGLVETIYDSEGEVRQTRVREDASLIARVVAARLPKYRDEKNSGTQIAIVINQTRE